MLSAIHPIATGKRTRFYVGFVPIASFAAAQKAERLFAVFDEPPYGTSMPGAGAVHTWHKATFAAPQ
jgi:hypothetical protein